MTRAESVADGIAEKYATRTGEYCRVLDLLSSDELKLKETIKLAILEFAEWMISEVTEG